jgi:putative DNA primase/helicase
VLTDLENGCRFAREHVDGLRYVSKYRRWLVWDGARWRDDDTGEVKRRARATVDGLHVEALKLTDSREREARLKLAIAAHRASRITAMIDLAASEPVSRACFLLRKRPSPMLLHLA